jgi:hypothetical protein
VFLSRGAAAVAETRATAPPGAPASSAIVVVFIRFQGRDRPPFGAFDASTRGERADLTRRSLRSRERSTDAKCAVADACVVRVASGRMPRVDPRRGSFEKGGSVGYRPAASRARLAAFQCEQKSCCVAVASIRLPGTVTHVAARGNGRGGVRGGRARGAIGAAAREGATRVRGDDDDDDRSSRTPRRRRRRRS